MNPLCFLAYQLGLFCHVSAMAVPQTFPVIRPWSCLPYISICLFTRLLSKGIKRLIADYSQGQNEDVLSLPFWGHSGWRRQARRWLTWKTRKKLHLFFVLALRFSGKPGWKMEDWGSRMKERRSGIKDHPFTVKKNFLHNSKYKAWYRGVGKRQKNTAVRVDTARKGAV